MIDDHLYFHRRAETELAQARRATDPRAVRAHHLLADAYLSRVSSLTTNDAGEHAAQ